MTKQQLAQCAGVTVRTLFNWCRPYRKELARMGLKPGMRVLPPHIVKWIADKFCIDLERSHTVGYVFSSLSCVIPRYLYEPAQSGNRGSQMLYLCQCI